MTEKQWRDCLGQLVRDYMRCPELEYYFSIKMNKPRAAVMVKQQSLFVRHRRECWSHVSANCPVMGVKQRILEHEYEEIIRDDYSDYGHLHLIIRQGKSVDVEPEEIINAEPTPQTRAALYAWSWMTSEMPWTEALAGMTITEWCNDDRLLGDLGGGQSTRMAKKWMEDMGFTWKQIPNMQAHSQADEKH
ncbi:MAG TPA: iron-containing redox enzyme family protein, partial [Candidatus Binatus sp.]|nr:iron-containing redox enzyme family protein [Candidatus Binatus sp.]